MKENLEFIIKGESYYSSLAQPNNKGQFASHCYEVGIKNPVVVLSKNTKKADAESITKLFESLVKVNDETKDKFIKIKNSRYPIATFENNGNKIELPRISNGIKFFAKCKTAHSEQYNTDYITVMAVKLIDDYKPFNPFEDLADYEI